MTNTKFRIRVPSLGKKGGNRAREDTRGFNFSCNFIFSEAEQGAYWYFLYYDHSHLHS